MNDRHPTTWGNQIMTHPPTLRKPTEGRTISVVGDVYRFLATGDDTNGKYAQWEAIVSPGGGPSFTPRLRRPSWRSVPSSMRY